MTKDIELIGRKRGYHHRDESGEVVAHPDCIDSATRWCQENVPGGLWMNRKHWFSFRRGLDAYAFRELWGDE